MNRLNNISNSIITINPETIHHGFSRIVMLLLIISCNLTVVNAQESTEIIRKSASFDNVQHVNNILKVYNVNGNVTIEGTDGDLVEIVAEKRIRADQEDDLERGIREIELIVEENGDHLFVYLEAPFIRVKKGDNRINYNINQKRDEPGYEYNFDITIRVPRHIRLYASTINNGDVSIIGMAGLEIKAMNVNGNVDLKDVSGKTNVNTVNGSIIATYTRNPNEDSEFSTVNGSIDVTYPVELDADINFKSLNGGLYSDFDNIRRKGTVAQASDNNGRRGSKTYRFGRNAPLQIGDGGPKLSFHVLNGDVYIQKTKI